MIENYYYDNFLVLNVNEMKNKAKMNEKTERNKQKNEVLWAFDIFRFSIALLSRHDDPCPLASDLSIGG